VPPFFTTYHEIAMSRNAAPYTLMSLSGFAGLGYEIVWTRMLSASLGHEIIAVLAVVAAFFGGLALGSWTLDRPLSVAKKPGYWYAGMEIAIGLWALSLSFGFPWANRLAIDLMGIDPGPGRHWAVALLFPFILLLPATFAMGGTLPAMERLLSRLQGGGRTVGGLYAANTFGAVAGTLAATFWITPALGFQSTQLILAGVNFICAGGMFLDGMLIPNSPQRAVFTDPDQPESLRIHISLFATGFTASPVFCRCTFWARPSAGRSTSCGLRNTASGPSRATWPRAYRFHVLPDWGCCFSWRRCIQGYGNGSGRA
jgi:spermidine synthase